MMKLFLWFVISTCIWSSSSASGHDFESLLRNDAVHEVDPDTSFWISGPNGYCVQAKDFNYTLGNEVILHPCVFSSAFIWTFGGTDGKLRAVGTHLCLSVDAYTQGSPIFLDYCNNKGIVWEIRNGGQIDGGQIVNPESGLALTATSGKVGTILTLDTNIGSSLQTWRTSNNTYPRLAHFIGSNGLCMHTIDNAVVLAECNFITVHQMFQRYPDGTIRPVENINLCLTYDNPINKRVIFLTCGLAPSTQRWVITADSMILNPRTNLVMEAHIREIIVSPPSDNPEQKWTVLSS